MNKSKAYAKEHQGQATSITLFLMTGKGYEFLNQIAKKYKILIDLIVVGNDKSLQKDFEEEIIMLCVKEEINFVKRKDFREVKSEYAIAVSWRWLIDHPSEKLIVFHDSLLPRYRGFAPLTNALINGEEEIGVSAIFGATDFDTGDIIFQSKSKVTYPITIFEAIQSNQKNYLNCAESILNRLLRGETLKGIKQIEGDASYSIWRDENDYGIDWSKSSRDIKRFVDAVGYPYLGALTNINGRRARIFGSDVYPDVYIENRHFGKVLFLREGKPVVICGKGLLMITEGKFEENEENEPLLPLSNFRVRFS